MRGAVLGAQVVAMHAKFVGEASRLGGATRRRVLLATDKLPMEIMSGPARRRSWRPRMRTCGSPYATIKTVSTREGTRRP